MGQKNRAEMKKLLAAVEKQGFEITRTKAGHYRVAKPGGRFTILSFSPGTSGHAKTLKQLRDIGYEE